MQLRVPSAYRSAFEWLATVPDDEAEQFIGSFEKSDSFTRTTILRDAAQSDPKLRAQLEPLFDGILGLIRSLQEAGEESAEDDTASVLANDSALNVPDESRPALATRIARLLRGRGLALLGKAVDLQAEHNRVFRQARIYSELRPMFDLKLSLSPRSVSLTHMLKIEYFDSRLSVDTTYIALDSQDLLELKRVVDREIDKLAALDSQLEEMGLNRILLWEEDS